MKRAESGLPVTFSALQRYSRLGDLPLRPSVRRRVRRARWRTFNFYTAMLSHLEDMSVSLNQLPLDRLPPHTQKLMDMAPSFAEIALAMELFGQPREDDIFDPLRFVLQHQ